VLAAQVDAVRLDRRALAYAAGRARSSVVHRTWERLGDELIQHYRSVLEATAAGRPVAEGGDIVPIRSGLRSRLRAS
jgi:phosphatidylinositol alpha 1,6-mannosyltransferase